MMNTQQVQEKLKRRFTLPNEIFQMDLSAGAKLVYAYLLYIEDRRTHQCYPSYQRIGLNTGMTAKTVRKYVIELVEKGLISTENTTVTTKKGIKRNGSLRYTIRPIKEAVELYEQRQLHQLELATALWNARKTAPEKKAG